MFYQALGIGEHRRRSGWPAPRAGYVSLVEGQRTPFLCRSKRWSTPFQSHHHRTDGVQPALRCVFLCQPPINSPAWRAIKHAGNGKPDYRPRARRLSTQCDWLLGTNTILSIAQSHEDNKTKSILIEHGESNRLVHRIRFPRHRDCRRPPSESCKWTQFALISIDIDDYVFNALLHDPVQNSARGRDRKGKPIGALEQIDVLAYFSNHSHLVAQRLDKASNVDDLVDIADQMTHSIQILHSSGVRAHRNWQY